MRSLHTSTLLAAAAALLTTSLSEAQISLQFDAVSSIDTFTADSSTGMPNTNSNPPGVLPLPFEQSTQSGTGAGSLPFDANASVQVTSNASTDLTLRAVALVTTNQAPAFAIVSPIDAVIEVALTPPNFAALDMDIFTDLTGMGTLMVRVDVFDDGTDEVVTTTAGQTPVDVRIPRGAPIVPVRVRAFATATVSSTPPGQTSNSLASVELIARVVPDVCDITGIPGATVSCGSAMGPFVPLELFDGSVLIRALKVPSTIQNFVVIGFSRTPTPLPFPLQSGTGCVLEPSPDILVPFNSGLGILDTLELSLVNLPSTPIQFYMQGFGIDPVSGTAALSRGFSFVCD